MQIVVDCSIAAAWAFKDEASPIADQTMELMKDCGGVAPYLWWWELTNVFHTAVRRGRCTSEEAEAMLADSIWSIVSLDVAPSARSMLEVLKVARTYQLSVYDAAYLELALRLNLPLATLDQQLKRAAQSAGLPQASSTTG